VTLPPLEALDAWLAEREARVPGLRPGCEKRILWADGPRRTPWSVVYVHGFSASRREVTPYGEKLAAGLGANFFGTRLTGHGQDGEALGRATLAEWRADVTEALAIGRALGDRVLAVSCSTGCTVLTLALATGEEVAATAMLSPNFGLRLRRLQVALDAPFAAHWAPFLIRRPQRPPAASSTSGIWTDGFPVRAYVPMAQAIRAIRRADLEAIRAPALFVHSEADQIVDPALTAAVMRRWGGPSRHIAPRPGQGDDPMAHVIAGDALSPGQTEPLVRATLDWIGAL
jgi:alpha-beta hydrolase superfamily lysophospholipase